MGSVTRIIPLEPMISPEQFFYEQGKLIIEWCNKHGITDYEAAAELIGKAIADKMSEELCKGQGETEPIGIFGSDRLK